MKISRWIFCLFLFGTMTGLGQAAVYDYPEHYEYISMHQWNSSFKASIPEDVSQTTVFTILANKEDPSDSLVQKFRFYIPPGAKNIKISAKTNQAAKVAAVRFGQPPTGGLIDQISSYQDYIDYNNQDVILGDHLGLTISDYEDNNIYLQNIDGNFFFIQTNITDENFAGGWLYAYIFWIDGYSISLANLYATCGVVTENFMDWYNTVVAGDLWDEYNDPPPYPIDYQPSDSCDPEHLTLCTETDCATDGQGFWCQATSSCVASEEECSCTASDPSGCTDPYACDAVGLWWYEGECHVAGNASLVDTDQDGVPDEWDECEATELGTYVSSVGCPNPSGDDDYPVFDPDLEPGKYFLTCPRVYVGGDFYSVQLEMTNDGLVFPLMFKLEAENLQITE